MLGRQSLVFGIDLVLELADLVLSDAEFLTQLDNLVISNDQVLAVEVSIGTNHFIEILLLLQLGLKFDVFLFQLSDQVPFELDLLDHLEQICIGLVCRLCLLVLLRLYLVDGEDQALNVLLILVGLVLERVDDLVFSLEGVLAFLVFSFEFEEGSLEHVTVPLKFHYTLLLNVCLLLEPVEIAEEVVHVPLRVLLLLDGIFLGNVESLFVVFEGPTLTLNLASLALRLIHLHVEAVQLLLFLNDVGLDVRLDGLKLLILKFA